jgi:hypothetical protein
MKKYAMCNKTGTRYLSECQRGNELINIFYYMQQDGFLVPHYPEKEINDDSMTCNRAN